MRIITLISFVALLCVGCNNVNRKFAIIVDKDSYAAAQIEIDEYANAIEKYDGIECLIIEDKWGQPDSIRAEIERLYKSEDIEGFALVGDIPVAMIRDAQHLTSAFKMDQTQPRVDSSIPSDRFYDDLELEFTYIDKDEDNPYFYYSLNYDSKQTLSPQMYSGRIRPMTSEGKVDIDALKAYLTKVVEEKASGNVLDNTFFFSGHGYISESMMARLDEQEGIYDHFPWLKGQRDAVGFIDHKQKNPIKETLMNELMREELDYAILHHHGYWDTQYLNGAPDVLNVNQAKDYITQYCRSHLQSAQRKGKSTAEVMNKINTKLGVPRSWVSDFNKPEVLKKDSLYSASLDLVLEDFEGYQYKPNTRVVIIDACFCGSFHRNEFIAGKYIFGEGKTVVCIANSVNVLQDKWGDKFVGLMGLGAPVGVLVQYNSYLESHVVGDPTFTFKSADKKYNVGKMLAGKTNWEKELNSKYPDIQALAMLKLYEEGEISSDKLLDIFKTSKYGIVRAQALELLSKCRDQNLLEAIKLGVNDGYEMTQRFAIKGITRSGDLDLVKSLISVCITNNTSERTNFNAVYALGVYPEDTLVAEFDRVFPNDSIKYVNKEKVGKAIRDGIISASNRWTDEMDAIVDSTTSDKWRFFNIRILRNNGIHHRYAQLIEYLPNLKEEHQIVLIEALGWHPTSYMREYVIEKLTEISNNMDYSEGVREEAIKTCLRLK